MKKIIISTLIVLTIGGCSQFKYPDLGNGYKFEYHSKYTLEIVDSTNTVLIDMCILEYGFDSTFIVVSQRPWDIPNVPGLGENFTIFAFQDTCYMALPWIRFG